MEDGFPQGYSSGISTQNISDPQNGQTLENYPPLLDLFQKPEQTRNLKTPHHNIFIDQIPNELLSLILICVKEAYDNDFNKSWYTGQCQSPHLVVGTICKKWRDITTQTPQLWTDIKINLRAPTDVQISMINEWARRSGVLPLKITIYLNHSYLALEQEILDQCEDVVKTLGSLAIRCNGLSLQAPWSYCHRLLLQLDGISSIQTLYHVPMMYEFGGLHPIKLKHPLRLKRFYSTYAGLSPISFEWNDLVRLEVHGIDKGDLLNIICHAPNLRHCETQMVYDEDGEWSAASSITPIIHRTLVHLRTTKDVHNHLTLPSLRYLEYFTLRGPPGHIDPLAGLINRSPPPLQTFVMRSDYWPEELNPCFAKLASITQLAIMIHQPATDYTSIDHFIQTLTDTSSKVVLPNLRNFKFDFPWAPPSSWLSFSRMFQRDGVSLTFGRPLSRLHLYVSGDGLEEETNIDPMLLLLEARKSAVDLYVQDSHSQTNLWSRMAKRCGVGL